MVVTLVLLQNEGLAKSLSRVLFYKIVTIPFKGWNIQSWKHQVSVLELEREMVCKQLKQMTLS